MSQWDDKFWDSLHANPKRVAYIFLAIMVVLCAVLIGWYFMDPESPYNQNVAPLLEKSIYSDHMHH